jgi:hypothetical protein
VGNHIFRVLDIDNKNLIFNFYVLTVTDMEVVQNFAVISDRFNIRSVYACGNYAWNMSLNFCCWPQAFRMKHQKENRLYKFFPELLSYLLWLSSS